MDWMMYFLILLAICVIYFFITRIWVGAVDLIFSSMKKAFGRERNKRENNVKWHTLEEIRDKKNKEQM